MPTKLNEIYGGGRENLYSKMPQMNLLGNEAGIAPAKKTANHILDHM